MGIDLRVKHINLTTRTYHPVRQRTMVKATLKGQTLAESDKTLVVEGNHYFPPDSVKKDLFTDSQTHTTCGWKGVASYYNVKLPDGTVTPDAAWYYPTPKVGRARPKTQHCRVKRAHCP